MTLRTKVLQVGMTAAVAWSSVTIVSSTIATAAPAEATDIASASCAPVPTGTAPTSPTLASFSPTTPTRIVDTRHGIGGVTAPVGAGCTLRIDVSRVVPADAEAVALSLTALSDIRGFFTVHPCSTGRLDTSNLNTRAGVPTPNLAVALPDPDGMICIFTDVRTEMIVDVTGWWTTGGSSRFTSIEPDRVHDTRQRPGRPRVPAESIHVIDLSADVPPGTVAVVGNLTIASPTGKGFATAFPCGGAATDTSNVNFLAREPRAAAVIIGIDAAARLCVRSSVDAHVVFDLAGYYEPTPFGPSVSLHPVPGERVGDSRYGVGGWNRSFGAGTVRRLRPLAGRPDADQATAVVIDVVAVQARSDGYVEVYPCDADDPETSVVNYTTSGAASNLAVVELSPQGELCVFTFSPTHVVVDLFGVLSVPADAMVERLTFGAETWPAFSRDQSDYAVRCGGDRVELELDLLSGTTARVNGVRVATGTIPLPGRDGELIEIRLARAGTSVSHWFRCVPDDLPRFDVERSAPTTPGWYLTVGTGSGAATTYALIMDPAGAPVWYLDAGPVGLELRHRSDSLLVTASRFGPRYGVPPGGAYQVITLTGEVVDEIGAVDEQDPDHVGAVYPSDHHDLVDLPDGRSAILSYPLLADQDLTALGSGYVADDVIADNVIQEIGPDDELLWSWRASEHFSYEEVTYPKRFPPVPWYDGDEVDVWHINSLDVIDDGSGDYVASARHLDAVFRIDRTTGDVEWILSPLDPSTPTVDGAQRLSIVGDPLGGPRRQHDARLDGDVLTLMDNRTDTGQPARAVAYRIDPTAGTATMLWSVTTASGRSSFGLGSHRTTFDGNSLVSWGNGPEPLFEEFSPAHESVLRFFQDGGGYSYRITKEPTSTFSAATLRATAGGAIG